MTNRKQEIVLPEVRHFARVYSRLDRLTRSGRTDGALDLADRELGLWLDPLSRRVFELVLAKAAEVPRFSGNDHIAPEYKGSVAQHTLMVMPLVAALGAQALHRLDPARPSDWFNAQAWPSPQQAVQDMLHDQLVQVLMHDFGEIFMELSSFSQRYRSELTGELPQIERRLAEFAMRLGYHCALSSPRPEQQERLFSSVIDNVRSRINHAVQNDKAVVGETVAGQILQAIEPHIDRLHLDHLPRAATRHLRIYMAAYDEPEGFSHFASFSGKVVKHAQNMQTVMHIIEHRGRGAGAVTYQLANSAEAIGSLGYAERGLTAIYNARRPGNSLHEAIAHSCADLAYQVNLGYLLGDFPAVVGRDARLRDRLTPQDSQADWERAEAHADQSADRQRELLLARARWEGASRGLTDFSTSELTRLQLQLAYAAARHELEHDPAYLPPPVPLARARELPPAIAGRMSVLGPPAKIPALIRNFTRRREILPL